MPEEACSRRRKTTTKAAEVWRANPYYQTDSRIMGRRPAAQYDTHHNSIITKATRGHQPTQAAFTIFIIKGAEIFNGADLQPGEQSWMDIGKLIREPIRVKRTGQIPRRINPPAPTNSATDNTGSGTFRKAKLIYDKNHTGHVTSYGALVLRLHAD